MSRLVIVRVAMLCVMLVGSVLQPFTASSDAATVPMQTSGGHKLIIKRSDAAALGRARAANGRMLADYGSFSLWRINDTTTNSLRDRSSVAVRDDFDTIYLRNGTVDTGRNTTPTIAAPLRQNRTNAHQLWLVQFVGPTQDDWLTAIEKAGAEIVDYLPNNAYVVWADDAALQTLEGEAQTDNAVQWTGPYHPGYRLAPTLTTATGTVVVTAQFYTTPNTAASIAALQGLGATPLTAPETVLNFTNVRLRLPAAQLTALASKADVFNVEPWVAPVKLDERQNQIIAGNIVEFGGKTVPSGPGYLQWLADQGFPTDPSEYPIVDVVDDGLDDGTTTPLHPDFYLNGVRPGTSRVIYNNNCTSDATGNAIGGHGNLNAGVVGGYNDQTGSAYVDSTSSGITGGYNYGLGVAPYTRLASTKIFRNSGNYDVSGCASTDAGVVERSYLSGATFTTNSWGASVNAAYDTSSQAYDALTRDASQTTAGQQPMMHIFAAGNDGPGIRTIGSPGTAKNVLTVGATENVRENGFIGRCSSNAADNADDIADYSSRGPATDGRVKPDIMAPGTHIIGPASQAPGYNGSGVCQQYHPTGQTLYAMSTGTSHSTPAVAGAASLMYTYYRRTVGGGTVVPSPAMLKAFLLNSTRYLDGVDANDTLPSSIQGWGDVYLKQAFDDVPKQFVDQATARTFGDTGQTWTQVSSISQSASPTRITLAWSDAPGATTGNAYVNDLHLEVEANGTLYKGNVFNGATSTSGGAADTKNNVENVYLPAGTSGPLRVRVVAANIAGDGVPGNADTTDQDWALVIYNTVDGPTGTVSGTVTSSTGHPINGAQVTGGGVYAVSDANGDYTVVVPVGTYDLTASKDGLSSAPSAVSVVENATTTQDFVITSGSIAGQVTDAVSGDLIGGATIKINGRSYLTDSDGRYRVFLAGGIHDYDVSKDGYDTRTFTGIAVASNTEVTSNFGLTPLIGVAPAQLSRTLVFGQDVVDTDALSLENTRSVPATTTIKEPSKYLIVSDRSPATQAAHIAFDALGYKYDTIGRTAFDGAGYSVEKLRTYQAVVWLDTSSTTNNSKLIDYLDEGGPLLIADNIFGFHNRTQALFATYLDATYSGTISGSPHTFTGANILSGVTTPSVDSSPDRFTVKSNSVSILANASASIVGSAITRNNYRAVLLTTDIRDLGTSAFGEAIEQTVFQKTLTWLTNNSDGIPWLTADPESATLAPNEQTTVDIGWDTTSLEQPGIYSATLTLESTAVTTMTRKLPVTITVTPAANQRLLSGNVTTNVCGVAPTPLAGATVTITDTSGFEKVLTTPASGAWSYYVETGAYHITTAAANHATQQVDLDVSGPDDVVRNFALRVAEPCEESTPQTFQSFQGSGQTATATLSITNVGTLPLNWQVRELAPGSSTCAADTVSWISTTPSSGTLAPDETLPASVQYNSTGLGTGVVTATLCLLTNDPRTPLRTLPVTLTVDADAPAAPTGQISPAPNAADWNRQDVSVSWTPNGDAGRNSSGLAGCTAASSLTAETPAEGTVVTGTCVDSVGNTSPSSSVTVRIDKTAPSIVATQNLPANAAGWNRFDTSILFTCTDDLSGIANNGCTPSKVLQGEGRGLAATGTATDRAGNTSAPAMLTTNIDRTAPVVTGQVVNDAGQPRSPNAAGWYRSAVRVRFTASDPQLADGGAGSGIATQPDEVMLNADGVKQRATGTAVDLAGNTGTKTVDGISIDSQAPFTVARMDCTGANGFCRGSQATVVLSATDQVGLSGVRHVRYRVNNGPVQTQTGALVTVPLSLSGIGTATVRYFAVDHAGNVESQRIATIKYDQIAPTVTYNVSPSPNAVGWNNRAPTVHFEARDQLNGASVDVADITRDVRVTKETDGRVITGEARDRAGNTGTVTVTVKLDRTAPAPPAAVVVPAPNAAGWNRTAAAVRFSAVGDLGTVRSEVATCTAQKGVTYQTAGATVAGICTDRAGNISLPTKITVRVDPRPPTVLVTGVKRNEVYQLGRVPTIGCSATDALSGVETEPTLTKSGPVAGVGRMTAICAGARDRAGNTALTVRVTYFVQYAFGGFEAPLAPLPVYNRMQAGRSVPVRFSLGGDHGLNVFARTPFTLFVPKDAGATVVDVAETQSSQANKLTYDASTGLYTYMWRTPAYFAGQWRTLNLSFKDGRRYSANFEFTR